MKRSIAIADYMTPRRWVLLASGVLGFSLFCSLSALVYTINSNAKFGPEVQIQAFSDTTILAFALAVPVLSLLGLKLFEVDYINGELERLASTDVLTGCLNRSALLELVEAHMEPENDNNAVTGALLVIDADHFKHVNDTLGHVGGDAALKHIADCIGKALRAGDRVARIGGEEFAVFLPGVTGLEAARIASRIVDLVHDTPFVSNGRAARLAVSVGGALFKSVDNFQNLYRVADANLYRAKQKGRDQAVMPSIAA